MICLRLLVLLALPALSPSTATRAAETDRRATLPAASAVSQTNSMDVLDDSRALGVGDRVSLRVVEERKAPVELIVTDSAEMEVPLIGRVSARGKTCKALAWDIKRLLEKDYFYKCNVILGLDAASTKSRGKIYLTGQVRGTGTIELAPEEALTASRAIVRAGGFTEYANRHKVKVVRTRTDGQQQVFIVDIANILEKGDAKKDVTLQPDDIIIVPDSLF